MKRPKKHIFLLALLMTVMLCRAQEALPVFSPDRPGCSWDAEVLPLHKISWENGFGFESSPDGARCLTLNNTILRYGIFESMELRVGTDFLMFNDVQAMEPTMGIAPLVIGTKIKVYESSNWLPTVGILAEFESSHIGSKDLLPSHLAPSMYVLFEHEINGSFSLCYNVGLKWDGETAIPRSFLALVLGYNITDDIGAFVESYNFIHPEQENQYMTEFGLTWMASRRVQLDVECELDFQNIGRYYAIGGGVAWMIN